MEIHQNITHLVDALSSGLNGYSFFDSFVPGYSIVTRFLADYLGLDVSRLVPWIGLLFALSKTFNYFYYQFQHQLLKWFACSIVITSDMDIYHDVTRFLSDRKGLEARSSSLLATMGRIYPMIHVDLELEAPRAGLVGQRQKHRSQEYEPMLDYYQHFWHGGRLFIWYRKREIGAANTFGPSRSIEATIYCFAPSTTPIKELIEESMGHLENKNAALTKIYRPASGKQRDQGQTWRCNAGRPSRPIDTVILNKEKKQNLVADIEQYLLPATRKWYAQRGIPYRRGYLFSGAPGTGKTSLSFALAGLLNLNIYCLSLAERSMTENYLFELFETLPRQCLVLLEDIDTAGLQKREDKTMGINHSDGSTTEAQTNNQISLSGLLNAIDGVASQEGRVLIMTTNDVTALDNALLRPGRIDFKVHFTKSSKQDACDLFIQTYMDYDGDWIDDKQEIPADLKVLGEQFGAEIPDKVYTPAEIQGYLLAWKNNKPEDAVLNVKSWVDNPA